MEWFWKAYRAITPFEWFWPIAGLLLLAPLGAADLQEFISQQLQSGVQGMNLATYYNWVLVFIVVALCWKLIQVQVPKFKITLPNEGDAVITPEKLRGPQGNVVAEFNSAYIRLRIEALSKTTISDCAGYIVSIKKKVGENWVDSNIQDSLQLFWSFMNQPSETSIPHRVVRHLDIIKARDDENKLQLTCLWPLRLRGFFDDPGKYRFGILVNGGGISELKTIDIYWGGEWETLKATEVDNV